MSLTPPYAVIDLGTNSLRILVASVDRDKFHILCNTGVVTRIGKGLRNTGIISNESLRKTINELHGFSKVCERLNVKEILLTGTSALREASNASECIHDIEEKTGLSLAILGELEEAYYSYHGGLYGLDDVKTQPILVDTGGGSTEVIWSQQGPENNLEMISLPLGALRHTEQFIHHDPPALTELESMNSSIQSLLKTLPPVSGKNLVGVGGTITTLAAVMLQLQEYDPDKIHGSLFSLDQIDHCFNRMVNMSFQKRQNLTGMEADRADIIIGGTAIILNIMKHLGFNTITVSDTGLRYGLLLKVAGLIPPISP